MVYPPRFLFKSTSLHKRCPRGRRFSEGAERYGVRSATLTMTELATETKTTTGAATRQGREGLPLDANDRSVSPSLAQVLDSLGDAGFRRAHGLRYAYVAGAMANGIASVELVEAMARGGMLGFFGAAGLSLNESRARCNGSRPKFPACPSA